MTFIENIQFFYDTDDDCIHRKNTDIFDHITSSLSDLITVKRRLSVDELRNIGIDYNSHDFLNFMSTKVATCPGQGDLSNLYVYSIRTAGSDKLFLHAVKAKLSFIGISFKSFLFSSWLIIRLENDVDDATFNFYFKVQQ